MIVDAYYQLFDYQRTFNIKTKQSFDLENKQTKIWKEKEIQVFFVGDSFSSSHNVILCSLIASYWNKTKTNKYYFK
jgi:hypothetical protein